MVIILKIITKENASYVLALSLCCWPYAIADKPLIKNLKEAVWELQADYANMIASGDKTYSNVTQPASRSGP